MTESQEKNSHSLVAVETGGASGLGKACAEHFAGQGMRVIVLDLNLEGLSSNFNNLIEGIAGDVSSEKDIQALADHVHQKYGRLDVLVNCAGIAGSAPTFDSKTGKSHCLEKFTRMLQVNTIGTFNVIRLLVPIMAKNQPDSDAHRGVIINTSSILGQEATAGFVAYAASKSAVAGMTLPLAREFGPLGIRVVAIAPGMADTPMIHKSAEAAKGAVERTQALLVFPKRMIRPEEFAQLAQSIIDNHMINAEVIRLDGGLRLAHVS